MNNCTTKFVAVWNKVLGHVIYGKIIGHINDYIIVEYWNNTQITNTISPSQQINQVSQYTGCLHYEQFYNIHSTSFHI